MPQDRRLRRVSRKAVHVDRVHEYFTAHDLIEPGHYPVLRLRADGWAQREIAKFLGLPADTVDNYLKANSESAVASRELVPLYRRVREYVTVVGRDGYAQVLGSRLRISSGDKNGGWPDPRLLLDVTVSPPALITPRGHQWGAHIEAIDALDREWFVNESESRDDCPGLALHNEWIRAFPDGYLCLLYQGQVAGYISAFFVSPSRFAAFKRGEITETAIRGNDLVTPDEAGGEMYCSALVVARKYERADTLKLHFLLAAAKWLESLIVDWKVTRLYAIAATRYGIRIMDHLAFREYRMATKNDPHTMYCLDVTKLHSLSENTLEELSTEPATP